MTLSDPSSTRAAIPIDEKLLAHLPVGICVCDPSGVIRYFNRRAVELWGRTPNRDDADENFCGAFKIYDVDGQLINFAHSPMAEVLGSGQPQRNREAIIKRPDGSQVRVLANIEPLQDEQGKLVGAVNVFHDVADQNQSAAAKQESGPQLRSIVDNVVDGIITIDEHGTVESLNRAAEAIFGYPADEVVGHNVRMLMPPPYREEHDGYIARYLETGQAKIIGIGREVVGLRRDGTTFPMDLAVSEFSLQGRRYFTGIVRDISERKRTEEALHRSEERFRQLAENVTDVFYVADARNLQMLYISPAYEQVWGRTCQSLDEMPGLFMETVHPDDRERVKSSIDRLRRGEVMQEEYRIRRADGSTRWIWDRGFPVRNSSGEVIRVAGIAEDITDRRGIEEDLRFLADASRSLATLVDYERTMQKVARDAVPHFSDWCVVHIADDNGALRQLAVVPADPAKIDFAKHLDHLFFPENDVSMGVAKVFRTGESEMVENVSPDLLKSTGQDDQQLRILQHLELTSYMCVPIAGRVGVLGTITFISAESGRRYNAADLAVAEDLAYRAAVAIENARLYSELKEAHRRKDEFLAMLAHELRNPLAPIRTGLDVLRMSGAQDESVELMQQQVEHLVRLVDDLLDVSRIMRGKIQLRMEAVEVATVVQRAMTTARPLVDNYQHRLDVSLPPEPIWMMGDRVRLSQIITNLLNNAAKYTEPGGQIWLKVVQEEEEVVFSVRDTGVGINKELLPHVFELFTQADRSLERSQGGLGIGLTLVQRLVKMHGGRVTASSNGEGQGSEFVVRLPILRHAVPPVPEMRKTTPASGRRILIVDDNAAAAKMLSIVLSKNADHEIKIAYDGQSALDAAASFRPDIVLLDIGLPRMNGYEVARRLRDQPQFDNTILVALTGYGTDEDRRRSFEAGFDVHLVKPPSLEKLQQVLAYPKR